MKRSLVVSAALTFLVAGSAMAADMPVKASPYHNTRQGCANFGGFYVGAQAGGASYNHTFNDVDAFAINVVDSKLPRSVSHSGRGGLAGAQAGYNWQSGCTVFGIESDWARTNAKASSLLRDGDRDDADSVTVTSKMSWFGTTRIRTGVVVDNLLMYVTGGLAYANFRRDLVFFDANCCNPKSFHAVAHGLAGLPARAQNGRSTPTGASRVNSSTWCSRRTRLPRLVCPSIRATSTPVSGMRTRRGSLASA
jgi:opacity protein-like surface antigen